MKNKYYGIILIHESNVCGYLRFKIKDIYFLVFSNICGKINMYPLFTNYINFLLLFCEIIKLPSRMSVNIGHFVVFMYCQI